MSESRGPLQGKSALITGVSRRRGIGFAIASRLLADGASVFLGHFSPHDRDQPWGDDDIDVVRAELAEYLVTGATLGHAEIDLSSDSGAADLMAQAIDHFGSVEILVCNHARSGSDDSLVNMDASMLDAHYFTNARSTVLLTSQFAQAFARLSDRNSARPGDVATSEVVVDEHHTGRVVWITSGQERPMPGEAAYAMSKAALAGLVPTAAAELTRLGILLNAINPGPVNTGYLDVDSTDRSVEVLNQVQAAVPLGRFGEPDDVARLVAWLVGDEGRWMTGQVITQDGGFTL